MAVTAKLYGNVFTKSFNKEIDLDTDTIKVMLTTSSYVPDQDAHIYKSSVTNEVTGTGYTARGVALGTKTVAYTSGTNTFTFDAADTNWTTSTITARIAVIYDDTGSDATSALIGWVDFGADQISTAGTFTITWDALGIFTVTSA